MAFQWCAVDFALNVKWIEVEKFFALLPPEGLMLHPWHLLMLQSVSVAHARHLQASAASRRKDFLRDRPRVMARVSDDIDGYSMANGCGPQGTH